MDLLLNSEHAPRNRRRVFPFSFVFYQKHLHSNSERLRSFNSSDFEFNFLVFNGSMLSVICDIPINSKAPVGPTINIDGDQT